MCLTGWFIVSFLLIPVGYILFSRPFLYVTVSVALLSHWFCLTLSYWDIWKLKSFGRKNVPFSCASASVRCIACYIVMRRCVQKFLSWLGQKAIISMKKQGCLKCKSGPVLSKKLPVNFSKAYLLHINVNILYRSYLFSASAFLFQQKILTFLWWHIAAWKQQAAYMLSEADAVCRLCLSGILCVRAVWA